MEAQRVLLCRAWVPCCKQTGIAFGTRSLVIFGPRSSSSLGFSKVPSQDYDCDYYLGRIVSVVEHDVLN